MKKIALSLVLLGILFGQNVSAQAIDQRPQTTKPAYEQIAVPDQDLNNTNKPILYRYKITAPKSGPLTISGETIEIQAVGVVPETINLKVFSDKDFKKEIDKKIIKFNVNLGKQKLNFAFKDPIKVKAGSTIYVQIDTATKGNKDGAYITTKPLGLAEVTVKAKPIPKTIVPKISYVQAKAADKNELYAGEEWVTLYGENIDPNTKVFMIVGDSYVDFITRFNQIGSIDFFVPKKPSKEYQIPDGKYGLYVMNGNKKSNILTITYKNQIASTVQTIKVLSPNGGETLIVGEVYKIKWNSVGEDILKNNVQIGIIDTRYSTEVGDRRQMVIANSIPNTGSYSWKVPEAIETMNLKDTDSAVYKISVGSWFSSSTVDDFSDEPFTITNSSTNLCSFTRDLTVGSQGDDVANLQNFLQNKGYLGTSGSDKGYFGSATQAALAKYQASIGISPADGYFGALTRAKVTVECDSNTGTENLSINIKNISTNSQEGLGKYMFDFDLINDTDEDIYVPTYIEHGFQNKDYAIRYSVINSQTGKPVFYNEPNNMEHTVSLVHTGEERIYNPYPNLMADRTYFKVEAGTKENVKLSITLSKLKSAGTYYVTLDNIKYVNNWDKMYTSEQKNLSFDPADKTFASPALYIPSSSVGTTTLPVRQSRPRVVPVAPSSSDTQVITSIDLELGMAHPDVIKLQKFLNDNGYTVESVAGEVGSKGNEGNYFGKKTQQALIKFQKDKGITPAQGYFGPKTRAVMGI